MGSHVNGTSHLNVDGKDVSLKDYLSTKEDLHYLFKVLSINDPLSIQVHPDKKFAEVLHKEDPEHYKDDNHKPEMAIVISPEFSLLYGLLPINKADELISILLNNNVLQTGASLFKAALTFQEEKNEESYKILILAIVNIEEIECKEIISAISTNLDKISEQNKEEIKQKLELIDKLIKSFNSDKGILFALFMNFYMLKFGDAVFIRPNLPHAYVYGDCMELMASSDNVIRLGLTPKFVDTKSFEKVN